MTGLTDTDIRLDDRLQLTRATDGDAPLVTGADCLFQNILLEALTQEGDLWYDPTFGWSLYDFLQEEDSELNRLEISQRTRLKLTKREAVVPETISVGIDYLDGAFRLGCAFRLRDEAEIRQLNLVIGAVSVEVVEHD